MSRPRLQKLQIVRRAVQTLVVLGVLAIPAVSRYTNYVMARELDGNLERWDGSFQSATLEAIDSTLRSLPDGEKERAGSTVRNRQRVLDYAQALRGGPWSAEVLGLSLTDPLAAAESALASRAVPWVLVAGVLVPLILTLLLGRVFCSWICPMGFFLELGDKLRAVLRFLELRPRDVKGARSTKYVLLVGGLLASFVVGLPILGAIYPPAVIGREAHDLVFGFYDRAEHGDFSVGGWFSGLSVMSFLLLAILVFELLVARRWWCRYVCPGGGLYSLLGALRPIRVARSQQRCTSCGVCNAVCPMALRPMQDKTGPECDNCGVCISNCGDKALGFALWRPRSAASPALTTEGAP